MADVVDPINGGGGGGDDENERDPSLQQEQRDHRDDEEEEEEECRVCRGPAEDGHPLYKPCKCSGSIGLTHQDCLQSWLKVQHGGISRAGRCELCKTPFKFAPVYQDGAPLKLPPSQVIWGVLHCTTSKWLPFLLRSAFCLSLWLLVAPLLTCWLYQAWMHRPYAIIERMFQLNLVKGDLVAGAVVLAIVIISFLSLMSFADFLRIEIGQRGGFLNNEDNNNQNNARNNNNNGGGRMNGLLRHGIPEEPQLDPSESDIDNELWDQSQERLRLQLQEQQRQQQNAAGAAARGVPSLEDHVAMLEREIEREEREREEDDDDDEMGEEEEEEQQQMSQEEIERQIRQEYEENLAYMQEHGHPPPGDDDDEEDDEEFLDDLPDDDDDDEYNTSDEERELERRGYNDDDEEEEDDSWMISEDDVSDEYDDPNEVNENRRRRVQWADEDENADQHQQPARPPQPDAAARHQIFPEVGPLRHYERALERQFLNQDHNRFDANANNNNIGAPAAAAAAAGAGGGQQPRRQGFQPNDARLGDIGRRADARQAQQPPPPQPQNEGFLGQPEEPIGEMDINIAFDELLGIRGPVGAVVRNLMWLLAFNTVYLGFFAFTPRVVGMAVTSLLFNTTNVLAGAATAAGAAAAAGGNASAATAAAAAANNITATTLDMFTDVAAAITMNETASSNSSVLLTDSNATVTTAAPFDLSSFWGVLRAIEDEGERQNTTFRLSVLISVGVGYLACAFVVLFLNCIWILSRKVHFFRRARARLGGAGRAAGGGGGVDRRRNHRPAQPQDEADVLEEINRIMMFNNAAGVGAGLGGDINNGPILGEDQGIALAAAIGVALDIMTAIVKVGVLLLLKMFLLPIALGLCLDVTSIQFFNDATLEGRVLYCGRDLFSCLLIHWVAGITFMLLVTVSVLQLREVAHPDLLAQIIRPQEPQPDLLGNLMHESVATHAKRMVLSLIIYACLLTMHIYIPVRLVNWASSNITGWPSPLLQFKVSYMLMPQELQVPLELLFFHLCMLGLLEKNKNSIGEMQHYWLKQVCSWLNITNAVLPRAVSHFQLVGVKSIYLMDDSNDTATTEIDPFWYDLAAGVTKASSSSSGEGHDNKNNNNKRTSRHTPAATALSLTREEMIRTNLHTFQFQYVGDGIVEDAGITKDNGEIVLRRANGHDYIRLPVTANVLRPSRSILLPTKIGRYRLKRASAAEHDNPIQLLELWEEVPGSLIARPPEGWDDLGVGGADIQQRWAWGREKKSNLERGVARRTPFYYDNNDEKNNSKYVVMMKFLTLLILSWITTTTLLFGFVFGPLAVGRFLYYISRFSDEWIHDPLAYAIGCTIYFPLLRSMMNMIVCKDDDSSIGFFEKLSMRLEFGILPPTRKLAILAVTAFCNVVVAPFLLGWIIDIGWIKSTSWFTTGMGDNDLFLDTKTNILNWLLGIILLDIWVDVCVSGVLTRKFWRLAGAADDNEQDPRNDNNNNAAAGGGGGDDAAPAQQQQAEEEPAGLQQQASLSLPWQGQNGRVAAFVDVWKSCIMDQDYDKIDHQVLLHDVTFPIIKQLMITLSMTILSLMFIVWCCSGSSWEEEEKANVPTIQQLFTAPTASIWYWWQLWRNVVFVRGVMLVTATLQLSFGALRDDVHSWFEAAHQAARDDRYLIGEVLIDYNEQQSHH